MTDRARRPRAQKAGSARSSARSPARGGPKAPVGSGKARAPKPAARPARPARPPRRTPEEIALAWAHALAAERPGLVAWTLDRLNTAYGRPVWTRRNDPISELVLTILSQNSADTNAEAAFDALCRAYPSAPLPDAATLRTLPGWGGRGIQDLPPPNWPAVETAPLAELIDVIRPGGLAPQKAPRVQAALTAVRDAAGGYSLEFLADMPAREARDWMTKIPGIGPKTASVVLLFSFGTPLMPVDRHVERVSKRIGLIPEKATADQAHEDFLALLEPERMYETHVDLITHGRRICHAQRPECGRCPVAERCRFVRPEAP